MRLVTVNTWGMRGDWPQRSRMFRDGFRRLDRDQQQNREPGRDGVPAGQGITTASRWPIGRTFEVDLHLTERTGGFACTCLLTEALAPNPTGAYG